MSLDPIVSSFEPKATGAQEHLVAELATLAVGRPTPSLVDSVSVEQYGSQVPLKSVAQINVGDGQSLVITPWDKQNLAAIEKAILAANLGFSPVNDGQNIRIILPPPSQERRQQLLKTVSTKAEEARVSIRNARQEVMQELKRVKTEYSEDEIKRSEDAVQKKVSEALTKIDVIAKNKETEISQI